MEAATHFSPTTMSRRNALEHGSFSTQPAEAPHQLAAEEQVVVPRKTTEKIVRVVNVIVAAIALVLLLPVMLLVALAVRLTSRGPVIFRQVRVGEDRRSRKTTQYGRVYDHGGRLFTIYKFRTMHVDAEADGQAIWAKKNDPRTTPIGKFLRSTRLDELPQLLNVLKGDMNIVGPRPERPSIFAQLRNDIPQYAQRQLVKPGITGWAQINQSYDTCLDDVKSKVRYDLEYVQRRGVRHDLRIMSLTLPVMLLRNKGW